MGDKLESAVWHYIETHELLTGRQIVGAAVSGGADSMALLICLLHLSQQHGFTVTALHYDHGTRGGQSALDARFVREFCEERGVPYVQRTGNVPQMAVKSGMGLELAGRQARSAFFHDVLGSGAVDAVATAHHMDDNAESIVLHMIRGCGTDGLAGIRAERDGIIRPFLGVARRDILAYLARTGTPHVEDASNADISFDRNFVRHVVLDSIRTRLNPSVSDALGRLADSAAEDADYLNGCAQDAFATCCTVRTDRACSLDRQMLRGMHPALASRVIRKALARIGRSLDVERVHIEDILRAACAHGTGARLMVGGGYSARTAYGQLIVERTDSPASFETDFVFPGVTQLPSGAALESALVPERGKDTAGSLCEYADADRIPGGAVVRTRRPGDRVRPLGAPGTKKLKDYFIDRKTPQPERDTTPLLACGSHILWIIGGVLSEDIAVRDDTRRICRLRLMGADARECQAEEE